MVKTTGVFCILTVAITTLAAVLAPAQTATPAKVHAPSLDSTLIPTQYNILVSGNLYGTSVSLSLEKATAQGNHEFQVQGTRPTLKWMLRSPSGKSLDCGVFEYG